MGSEVPIARSVAPSRAVLPLLLALSGACSGGDEPVWIPLTPESTGFGQVAGERTLTLELARADWQAQPVAGLWRAASGIRAERGPFRLWPRHRLADARRAFQPVNPIPIAERLRSGDLAGPGGKALLPAGGFALGPDALFLQLEPGSEPAPVTSFTVALGAEEQETPGRVRRAPFSGEGFALWPGASVAWTLDLLPGSSLRFATAFDPVLAPPAPAGEMVFRVRIDGSELWSEREPDPAQARARWHEVALPEAGRRGASLAFEVEGLPAYASILAPVVGPRDVGRPGQRPWREERPDVLLFLADTFRADNLTVYGGEHALTPRLDALAGRARVFRNAWSVATYTLPAHATLFSGLFPHQAGIGSEQSRLPDELATLAEELSRAGYRTGAITDSGLVSHSFGFDQGFAYFDEQRSTLARTFERALEFLDADDGRPVFLFVQSYRVHREYEVSPETRAAHGERLGIRGEIGAVEQGLMELARAHGHVPALPTDVPGEIGALPEARLLVADLRAHYQGGVLDFDRAFGGFLEELERRAFLEHGVLVFTSDHGEAFAEHGELYHARTVFEEKTRIPLLVAGRGIEPGLVETPASLIDVPLTIAELAGLPRPAGWLGSSLFDLPAERSIFAFECRRDDPRSTFAALQGGRKLIGYERPGAVAQGGLVGAYDLARDPGETRDLAGAEAWPHEQLERLAPAIEPLLVPAFDRRAAELDPAKLAELEALGYGGGN
jgi:arylsulfatase